MIKDISGNSSNGTIHFERVDGTSGNFNIADMQYFKSSMSAEYSKGYRAGDSAGYTRGVSAGHSTGVSDGWDNAARAVSGQSVNISPG